MQVRSLPLDVSRSGSEVMRQLFVTDGRIYVFKLRLKFKDGDKEDKQRLQQLLVRDSVKSARSSKDESSLKLGIAVPLRIRISVSEPGGERILVEKELNPQRLAGMQDDSAWFNIGSINLQPGFYRLRVESLRDVAELSQALASVEISWTNMLESEPAASAEMMSLVAQIRKADLFNHLSVLQRVPLGTTDRGFLRAETFSVPDATGVLDPCTHRLHLDHLSGGFMIVRRCAGGTVDIYRGVQRDWSMEDQASRPAFRFGQALAIRKPSGN